MNREILILNYGIGNVRSIYNSFLKIGANVRFADNIKDVNLAKGLVIPGVGAFSAAKKILDEKKLFEPVRQYLLSGRPALGICLGMQLFLSESEENGRYEGFSVIPGKVKKIAKATVDFKLPHIGWSTIYPNEDNKQAFEQSIINHLEKKKQYFVHSYVSVPDSDTAVLANVKYGSHMLACAIQSKNVIGLQFHPEKSGEFGLEVLKKFVNLVNENNF